MRLPRKQGRTARISHKQTNRVLRGACAPLFIFLPLPVVVKGKCQYLMFSDFVSPTPSATKPVPSSPPTGARRAAVRWSSRTRFKVGPEMSSSLAACRRVMAFCSNCTRTRANVSVNPSHSSTVGTPIRLPDCLARSIPARVNSLCLFFLTGSSYQIVSPAKGPSRTRVRVRRSLTLRGGGSFHITG